MVYRVQADPHPLSVLMVEDHPGDVRLTEELFKDAGYPVDLTAVGNGDEAIVLLRELGTPGRPAVPDVILLDLNTPGIDPDQLVDVLDRDPAMVDIPIVVLTGTEPIADPRETLGGRVLGSLVKPLDVQMLLDLLLDLDRG